MSHLNVRWLQTPRAIVGRGPEVEKKKLQPLLDTLEVETARVDDFMKL